MGAFLAVVSILLAASESGSTAYSRTSGSSASRKLEFIALLIPTSGVLVINQLVLYIVELYTTDSHDLTGLQ